MGFEGVAVGGVLEGLSASSRSLCFSSSWQVSGACGWLAFGRAVTTAAVAARLAWFLMVGAGCPRHKQHSTTASVFCFVLILFVLFCFLFFLPCFFLQMCAGRIAVRRASATIHRSSSSASWRWNWRGGRGGGRGVIRRPESDTKEWSIEDFPGTALS